MDAVVFASFVPAVASLPSGTDVLDAIARDFRDCDVFVGINRPSVPEWEQELERRAREGLRLRYAYVDEHLTINSDASAFQRALLLMRDATRASGMRYGLIWFGHTKGATSAHRARRLEYVHKFFGKRRQVERRFRNERVGSFGRYITVSTLFGYTDKTLDSLYPFPFTAVNTIFLNTFYVLRGKIVQDFLEGCEPTFFAKNLVDDFGFDRYFFERDFPNIADKMGFEPDYQFPVDQPHWNKVDRERVSALIQEWRYRTFRPEPSPGTCPTCESRTPCQHSITTRSATWRS